MPGCKPLHRGGPEERQEERPLVPLALRQAHREVCPEGPRHALTSTIILTVGSVVERFWGCGGRTVTGTQPQYRQP